MAKACNVGVSMGLHEPTTRNKTTTKTLLNIFITPIELMNIFSDIHVYILFLFMKQKLVSIQML